MFYNQIHKIRRRSWIKEICHARTYQVVPESNVLYRDPPIGAHQGPPLPPSLPLSLIRISLPRLDGCRVESRPMRWPAVFGIRTRVGPVCSRAFDEWLAWLLCLAWEYDPSILLGRRSSRHWFMKYPILHNSKLSIENAAAPHTDTWAIYDPLGGGGTITV